MKNTRIYPLRTASSIWKIKLYSKHICNDMCKFAYIQADLQDDNSSIMFIINNPEYKDGKCPYSMKLNPSSVQISNFDKSDPSTIDGDLLFYNNIVIPDTQIYLHLTFPLKEPKNIRITSDNPLGFSLSSLINKIKNVYKWVYEEEENTSSTKTFTIIDQCNCIINYKDNIINSLSDISLTKEEIEEKCPICLENLISNQNNDNNDNNDNNITKKTICNHLFHKNCIYQWIDNNKNTCPLCRKALDICLNNCKNGLIYKQYTGKIIPKHMRGILSRNLTDGVFGLYGYDFEDLFIDEMVYNRTTKILYPKIFA